jgi:predicted metalloprotease with PDZ domain
LKIFLQFIFAVLTFTGVFITCINANQEEKYSLLKESDADIIYSIEPYYEVNSFRFIVTMEFKGNSSGTTNIILPNEFGGVNNLGGIKNLKTLSENTYLYDSDYPEVKIIKHKPNTNVRIYYQVEETRYGDIQLNNIYMTVLNKKYFHFFGETFFIIPDWDSNANYKIKIYWNHLPSNWSTANSFGVNEKYQSVQMPLWKFRGSVFTGGDFRILKRTINDNPVYVSIRGKWNFTDNQIADLTQTILKEERDFWNDYKFPFYLITVLPINERNGKSSLERTNALALFLSNKGTLDNQFKRLLSHNIFHTWLGGKIIFNQPEQLLYWFKEGFTDYYSRLILLRADQISLAEYINDYNNVLEKYFTSALRFEKNSFPGKDPERDRDLSSLSYQRGDIIAHNLNAEIIKNSDGKKSLDDFMKELLNRCSNENLVLSSGSLSALIRYYAGDEILSSIMRTLNSGTPLKANPDALGPCVSMQINSYRSFWLFGEKYDVPVYQFKNQYPQNCLDWFYTE